MKKKIVLIIFFIFFYFKNLEANNLAFIDLDYLINNLNIGKKVIKNLEEINNQNLESLKKDQISLDNDKDILEKTKNIISKEELDKKIALLNDKLKKLQQKQNVLSQEFKKLRESEINNLLIKINPIIENYMIDNNIDLILKKENVYISKINYDITNKLIEIINKKLIN